MSLVFGLRSWYSYAEGYLSPRDAVLAAKRAGATCVAFADKGEMAGYFEFVDACRENSLSYIPGVEVNLACSGETRQALLFGLKGEGERKLWDVLAKSTLAAPGSLDMDVSDALPIVTPDMLDASMMVLSGQHGSHLMGYRRRHEILSAQDFVKAVTASGARLATAVDPESVEPKEKRFFDALAKLGVKSVPYRPGVIRDLGQLPDYQSVATLAFQGAPEHFSYEVPLIQSTHDLAGRNEFPGYDPEAVAKLADVAAIVPIERVAVHGDLSYRGMSPEDSLTELKTRCMANFEQKVVASQKQSGQKPISAAEQPAYHERLEKELQVVKNLNFQSRLLLMADLVEHCKVNGKEAFARGSAANSVICWMTGISKVDPITHKLPSERFLNPERPSMPDIDIDIPRSFSEAAFSFLGEHVPHSVRIKQPRDAALGDFISKIAMHLDVRNPEKLGEAVRSMLGVAKFPKGATVKMLEAEYPDFRENFIKLREDSPDKMDELYSLLSKVGHRPLGFNPHVGLAACEAHVESKIPVLPMRMPDGEVVKTTGIVHSELEEHGVLKFDLLPRKTLDWMQRIIDRSPEVKDQLPALDDIAAMQPTAAFHLLRQGLVAGIDQIHKHSETLKTLPIQNFSGLCTFIALIRPGASGGGASQDENDPRPPGVVRYLKKASPLKSAIADLGKEATAIFKSVTAETPGMIIYQEQFSELLHRLSDAPVGNCDLIRAAMAKKKALPEKTMAAISGRVAKKFNVTPKLARTAIDQLANEGDYLFAKGHSATYAVVALHQLAIKNLVPASFVAGYIDHSRMDDRSDSGGVFREKLCAMMGDIRQQGVSVLAMDFSRSPLTAIEGSPFTSAPLRRQLRLGIDAISTVPTSEVTRVRDNIKILEEEIAKGKPPTPERMQAHPFLLSGETIGKAALLGAFHYTKRRATAIAAEFAEGKVGYQNLAEAAYDILGFVPNQFHPGLPTSLPANEDRGRRIDQVVPADKVQLYEKNDQPFHMAGFLTEAPRKWSRPNGSIIEFQLGGLRGQKPLPIKMFFFPGAKDRGDGQKIKRLALEADQVFARLTGHQQKHAMTPLVLNVRRDIYRGRVGLVTVSKRIDVPSPDEPQPSMSKAPVKDAGPVKEVGPVKKESAPTVAADTLTRRRPGDK